MDYLAGNVQLVIAIFELFYLLKQKENGPNVSSRLVRSLNL